MDEWMSRRRSMQVLLHDSFINVTWLIHMRDMTETWLIYIWTYLYMVLLVVAEVCRYFFSHTDESFEQSTSLLWMSHVTHINESCLCLSYEWVMSHLWMSHFSVSHVNGSCHIYEWVISLSLIWMSHVTCTNESFLCLSYEWVKSRVWLGHRKSVRVRLLSYWMNHVSVSHMNESCHIYEWVLSLSLIWMSHVSLIKVCEYVFTSSLINIWEKTYSHTFTHS